MAFLETHYILAKIPNHRLWTNRAFLFCVFDGSNITGIHIMKPLFPRLKLWVILPNLTTFHRSLILHFLFATNLSTSGKQFSRHLMHFSQLITNTLKQYRSHCAPFSVYLPRICPSGSCHKRLYAVLPTWTITTQYPKLYIFYCVT